MAVKIRTVVEVCVGLHCSMCGVYSILEQIRKHYNLEIGVPSNDGMLLKEVECFHSCNNSIVVFINGVEYKNSSFKSIIKYIESIHIKV